MATLRDVQKQRTRQSLLEHGLRLFGSRGYTATTIDDIAGAAGATRATFYLHFPSKAALMKELLGEVDALLTGADDPPLATVIEVGRRDLVHDWLERKTRQWKDIRPYLLIAHQVEASEPEVAATIDKWFDATLDAMHAGLDAADRYPPEQRHARCLLAFGQFEFLSRQWFRRGWQTDPTITLDTLTDSWCHLLTQQ